MFARIFLLSWSLGITLGFYLLRFVAFFFPQLKHHLEGRVLDLTQLSELLQGSATKPRLVVFCSSAGEYEQAVPLIETARLQGDYFVLIVFFSPSGLKFIKARGDKYPYMLAPYDSLAQWKQFFSLLRPRATVVVRHELWPAFLTCARAYSSRLLLVNVSRSSSGKPWLLRRLVKRWLLGFFEQIFLVSPADTRAFSQWFALPPGKLQISGDSKYDRVLCKSPRDQALTVEFSDCLAQSFGTVPRLLLGSAWPEDYELVLAGLEQRQKEGASGLVCLIALHEPTPKYLAALVTCAAAGGFTTVRFSQLLAQYQAGKAELRASSTLVLVDSLGILSALYGACNLAWVGGAMHHKIHNVLEPASYGLAIAHGPLYKNSGEAIALVQAKLACLVEDHEEFARWCSKALAGKAPQGAVVRQFLEARGGASKALFAAIQAE